MENKQTAIEWLSLQVKNSITLANLLNQIDAFEKEAKAMEKEQISNGYYQGLIDGMNNSPREYYEETYGTRQSNN